MTQRKILSMVLATSLVLASTSATLTGLAEETQKQSRPGLNTILRNILNEALQEPQQPNPEPAAEDTTTTPAPTTTSSTTPTATTQPSYDELKAQNEQLKRRVDVLQDMKFQETMRRIEGLNMRKQEVERNIKFLETEKTELTKHIDYLQKQLEAYQGNDPTQTTATPEAQSTGDTPASETQSQ